MSVDRLPSPQGNEKNLAGPLLQVVREWSVIWLPLLLAISTAACSWMVYQSEKEVLRSSFESRVANAFDGLRENLSFHGEVVQSMAELFEIDPKVTHDDFVRIAKRHIRQHESIKALSWTPVVEHADRQNHESTLANIFPGYSLKQWQPGNTWKTKASKWSDVYFPVSYIHPRAGNEPAFGIDLASNPTRALALEKARDTGQNVATARIVLAQAEEGSDQPAFLIFVPIYHDLAETVQQRQRRLIGFCSGVFNVNDIVNHVFETRDVDGVQLQITDESAVDENQQLLFSNSSKSSPATKNLLSETTYQVGGREWKFRWSCTDDHIAQQQGMGPWLLLLGGTLLSGLLGITLNSNAKMTRRVQHLADERTVALRTTQEQLRQRTSKLESIFESMPLALAYSDSNRRITGVNPAFTETFGYAEDEIIGQSSSVLYADQHQFLQQGNLRFNKEASSDLGRLPFEIEYARKSGSRFVGETVGTVVRDSKGAVIGMLCLINDVTDRKAADRELRLSHFAVEHASDAVFWIREDGSFSNANQKATEQLGYQREELLQMTVSDINLEYSNDTWPEHWQETKQQGVLKFETVHYRKDGTTYQSAVTKHFLSFEGQEVIFATARDISSQKAADAALLEAKQLAEESERRFRRLANSASTLCWVTELDSTCSWLNTRWLKYCGRPLEEQTGFGWLETVHPDDRELAKSAYMAAFEKQSSFALDYRLRRHDGTYRWHTADAVPRLDDDGEFIGFVGMSIDTHDARQSRQALEASELSLKNTSESLQATLNLLGTSDGVWDWTVGSQNIYYAPGFRRLFGFDGDDVDGFPDVLETFESRIHPNDKDGFWQAINQSLENKTPFVFEFQVRCKDEQYIWVRSRANASFDDDGKAIHLVGSAHDISAQKNLEHERDRFFNTAAELLAVVDLKSLKWLKLSPAWSTNFGYDLEQLLEIRLPEMHPEEEHAAIQKQVGMLLSGKPIRGWVCQTFHRDGSIRYIEWNIDPPLAGETVVYGTGRDVTELRRYMEQIQQTSHKLESTNSQLERSNEDLAQFAHVASHDLQEPLRAISGFLQLLSDRHGDALDEQARGYIGKAVAGASRMNQLINDLLHYSQVTNDESAFQQVSLNQCVSIARTKISQAIKESKAELDVAALPEVSGIEPLLVQLFQNLIGNAVKYRRANTPPRIKIWADSNAAGGAVYVQDNGIGIAEEYQDQVFALFKRLHRRDEIAGTGIGLAICQRVLERHGGSISVTQNEEHGSCFKVQFSGLR